MIISNNKKGTHLSKSELDIDDESDTIYSIEQWIHIIQN